MPDVKHVTVILANPVDSDDTGRVTYGHYILEGSKLTMTTSLGEPVRRINGDKVQRPLTPDDDPELIARLLTKEFRRHITGDTGNFNRKIVYPRRDVC